jgi:hypothetical protein
MITTKTKPTAQAGSEGVETTPSATKRPRAAKEAKVGAKPPKAPKPRQKPAQADTKANTEPKARTDTKQAKLIEMLRAKDGATVEEIATAFGWQHHTVRSALYGALKKKLGLDIASEKVDGRGRVYRIGN